MAKVCCSKRVNFRKSGHTDRKPLKKSQQQAIKIVKGSFTPE